MAAILRDSTVVVVVVRTRPRAIPLAMITTRKSIHGFPLVSYMGMGLRLAALRAAGAPLSCKTMTNILCRNFEKSFLKYETMFQERSSRTFSPLIFLFNHYHYASIQPVPVVPAGVTSLKRLTTSSLLEHLAFLARQRIIL